MYGDGPNSQACCKEDTIAWCSTRSDSVARMQAYREAFWLQKLLKDFGTVEEIPAWMIKNNQSSTKLSQSEKMNGCTQHIRVRYQMVHDLTEKGLMQMIYMS